MPQLDKDKLNALEIKLYNKLRQIKDDDDWLYYRFCSLNTEDRQKAMLEYLDENQGNYDALDVSLEAEYIANRYPNLSFPAVVREELETDLEKRLYDKLIQVEDYDETWLAFIFNCIPTEELKLNLLGYLNEGHDDYVEIWEYASDLSIDYHHRNCDWYDPKK